MIARLARQDDHISRLNPLVSSLQAENGQLSLTITSLKVQHTETVSDLERRMLELSEVSISLGGAVYLLEIRGCSFGDETQEPTENLCSQRLFRWPFSIVYRIRLPLASII